MFIYLYFKVNQFILFDLKLLLHGVSHSFPFEIEYENYLLVSKYFFFTEYVFFLKGDNTNNLNVFNLELSGWTV